MVWCVCFSDDVWFLQLRWRHNQICLPSISFNAPFCSCRFFHTCIQIISSAARSPWHKWITQCIQDSRTLFVYVSSVGCLMMMMVECDVATVFWNNHNRIDVEYSNQNTHLIRRTQAPTSQTIQTSSCCTLKILSLSGELIVIFCAIKKHFFFQFTFDALQKYPTQSCHTKIACIQNGNVD